MENSKSISENRKLMKKIYRKFGWKTKTIEWIQKKMPNIMNNSAVDINKFFKAEQINYLISKDLFGGDTKGSFYLRNGLDSKEMLTYFNRLNVLIPKVIGCKKYPTEKIGKIIMEFKSQKRTEKENRLKQKSERSSMNLSQNSNYCTLSKEQMHSNTAFAFPTSTLSAPTSLKNREVISVFCQNQFQFPKKELLPHSVSSVNKQTPIFKLIIKEFNSTCNTFIKKNTAKGKINERNKMDEYLLYCLCYIFSLLPYTRNPTDKRHSRDAVLKIMSKLDKNQPCFFERKTYKNFDSLTGIKVIINEKNEWEGKGRETESNIPTNEDNDKAEFKRSDEEVPGNIEKNIEFSLFKSQPITEPNFHSLKKDKNKEYSVPKTDDKISGTKAEDTGIPVHKIDNQDSRTKDNDLSSKTNEGVSSEVTVSPDFSVRQFEKLMDTENEKESSSKPVRISNEIVASPNFSVNRSENITESEIGHYTKQDNEEDLQEKTNGKDRDQMSSEFSVHQSESGADTGYGNSKGNKSEMYLSGEVSGRVPGEGNESPDFSIHRTDNDIDIGHDSSQGNKTDMYISGEVSGRVPGEGNESPDFSIHYSDKDIDIGHDNSQGNKSDMYISGEVSGRVPGERNESPNFSIHQSDKDIDVGHGSSQGNKTDMYISGEVSGRVPGERKESPDFSIHQSDKLRETDSKMRQNEKPSHQNVYGERINELEENTDISGPMSTNKMMLLQDDLDMDESSVTNTYSESLLENIVYQHINVQNSETDFTRKPSPPKPNPITLTKRLSNSRMQRRLSVKKSDADISVSDQIGENVQTQNQIKRPPSSVDMKQFIRNKDLINYEKFNPEKRQSLHRKSVRQMHTEESNDSKRFVDNEDETLQMKDKQSDEESLKRDNDVNSGLSMGYKNISISISQVQQIPRHYSEISNDRSVRNAYSEIQPVTTSARNINISISQGQPFDNVSQDMKMSFNRNTYDGIENVSEAENYSSKKQSSPKSIQSYESMNKIRTVSVSISQGQPMGNRFEETQSFSRQSPNRSLQNNDPLNNIRSVTVSLTQRQSTENVADEGQKNQSVKRSVIQDSPLFSSKIINVSVTESQPMNSQYEHLSNESRTQSTKQGTISERDKIIKNQKQDRVENVEDNLVTENDEVHSKSSAKRKLDKNIQDPLDIEEGLESQMEQKQYNGEPKTGEFGKKSPQTADDIKDTSYQETDLQSIKSLHDDFPNKSDSESISNRNSDEYEKRKQSSEKSNVPSSKKNISEANLSKSVNQTAEGSLAKTHSMEKSNDPSSKKNISEISKSMNQIADGSLPKSQSQEKSNVPSSKKKSSNKISQNPGDVEDELGSQYEETENAMDRDSIRSYQNRKNSVQNINVSLSQGIVTDNSYNESQRNQPIRNISISISQSQPIETSLVQTNKKRVTNDNEVDSNLSEAEVSQYDRKALLKKSLQSYEKGQNSIRSINVSVTQGPMNESIYADISHQPSILQNDQEPSRVSDLDSTIAASTRSKPLSTSKKMSINKNIPNPVHSENQPESDSEEMERMYQDTSKNVEKNLNVSLSQSSQVQNADDKIEKSSKQDLNTSLSKERQERNKFDINEDRQFIRKGSRDVDSINTVENINITVSEPFYMDNVPQTMVIDIVLHDDFPNKISDPDKEVLGDSGQYRKNKVESVDRTTSVTDNLYRQAASLRSPQTQDQTNVKSASTQPDSSRNEKISSNIAWSDLNSSGIISAKEHIERNFQETVAQNADLGDNMFGIAHDLLKETQMIHQVQLGLLKNVARETNNEKDPSDLTKTESVYYDAEVCSDLENSEIHLTSIKINVNEKPSNSENHNESIGYESSYKDCRSSVHSPYKNGNSSNSSANYSINHVMSTNQLTKTSFNGTIK